MGFSPSPLPPLKFKLPSVLKPQECIKMKKTKKQKQKNTLRQIQRCRRVNISINSEYTKTQTDVSDSADS